jgi:hypothetical protein
MDVDEKQHEFAQYGNHQVDFLFLLPIERYVISQQSVQFFSVLRVPSCKKEVQVCNTHCSKILQETLLNSVANDLLPLMVGQSRESFSLLSANDVGLFQHHQ